ncbi:hypothetical protein RFI_21512 [Reticulomyxa filosa]|uniref:Peptidase M1 membrane alanine aminopeptidase domain-containing protein n=1 Tax=Reticulomyxa filosa TaxID=46433 RepID=X6MQD5_RETFI|nr:hypothetical protein RFI_21512 [Reticulomyxa filosa]|eukprot:ETO15851.1 hypothetical protein RFI_21512 [Reticulomyxa filosa]
MENWGLVTYRTSALLVSMYSSSLSNRKRVTTVVAHELAHQWFGDIVTMEWWDDLWLNEGFASFVENIGTDYAHPEFKIWETFLDSENSMLFVDSSYFTHPVEAVITDPKSIDTLFDSITYDKGSSVIRMCYEYLGPNVFMSGINQYLTQYAYGNANNSDLWTVLRFANIDISFL